MTRDEAEALLKRHVKNERMLDHSYASEAVLRALARRLGRDEEKWGLAGLLHDIDIEAVGGDLTRHGSEAEKILAEAGLDPEIVDAVKMHNETVCGAPRQHRVSACARRRGDGYGSDRRDGPRLSRQKDRRRQGEIGDEADEGEGLRGLGEPRHDPGVRKNRAFAGRIRRDLARGDAGDSRNRLGL